LKIFKDNDFEVDFGRKLFFISISEINPARQYGSFPFPIFKSFVKIKGAAVFPVLSVFFRSYRYCLDPTPSRRAAASPPTASPSSLA